MGLRRLFRKEKQEHRIMREAAQRAGNLVPEYHRPTPECPHPERWSMYDSMTAEVEVLEFVRTLVIAEGLRMNGFGRVVSCEYDPKVFAAAKERIETSPFRDLIDLRNE